MCESETLKHGAHISTVHSWIQAFFSNGDRVTWGSNDQLGNSGLTVIQLEGLAQRIKDALFREYHIKDKDYKHKYVVCIYEGAPAFQGADTMSEIWNCLFKGRGKVDVHERASDGSLGAVIFSGTIEEAREWAVAPPRKCLRRCLRCTCICYPLLPR